MIVSYWFPFTAVLRVNFVLKKGFPIDFLKVPFLSTRFPMQINKAEAFICNLVPWASKKIPRPRNVKGSYAEESGVARLGLEEEPGGRQRHC